MSHMETANYARRLDRILKDRTAMNPSYSLRAFARDIGVSPSQLSLILNGKRGISPSLAKQIAARLHLTADEHHAFVTEIQSLHSRNKNVKKAAQEELETLEIAKRATFLSIDAFSVIANWYHLAIVEAIKLNPKKSFKSTEAQLNWLSQKLGVPAGEIEEAMGRLTRLELVELKGKNYRAVKDTIFTGDKVPSEAVRSYHKQVIQKAHQAVETQSPEERYLRSTMVPIAKSDLPEIKDRIKKFHESLIRDFGNAENADTVYAFSTQGFSVLNEEKEYEEL